MRITIDARMMGAGNTRGIGRYIEELVRAMLEEKSGHRFILVTRTKDHPFANHPDVETIVTDIPWYGWKEQLLLSDVFRAAKGDFVHVPHWNMPLSHLSSTVITIHDLLLRHFPESAKASTRSLPVRLLKRLGYRLVLDRAIFRARVILVPSEATKRDVISFYPPSAKKIVVTGEGMPTAPLVEGVRDAVNPYLLYVGSAYPHKGLEDVLAVWPKIVTQHPHLTWKIAGEKDAFMQRLENEVKKRGASRIEFLGRVSDEGLTKLYQGATAFVYPSHFEGFGLPPLEAISAGCPVISADSGSLPEVLGKDGAFFFQAGDADGILRAVAEVLADPTEAREKTARLRPSLAKRHSWKKAAQITLDAYRRAGGKA